MAMMSKSLCLIGLVFGVLALADYDYDYDYEEDYEVSNYAYDNDYEMEQENSYDLDSTADKYAAYDYDYEDEEEEFVADMRYADEETDGSYDEDSEADMRYADEETDGSYDEDTDEDYSAEDYDRAMTSKSRVLRRVNVGGSFSLSFDLVPRRTAGGWRSILHVGNRNTERLPGIWFHGSSTRLHVCVSGSPNWNTCVNPPQALRLNNRYRLSVSCAQDMCTLKVFGSGVNINQRWRVANRRQFNGRNLYVSDPWYGPAIVDVSNVRWSGAASNRLVQRRVLRTVNVRRYFRLEFNLIPRQALGGWRSIVHIGNVNTERLPGIWFHGSSTRLHVCVSGSPNWNTCVNPPQSLRIHNVYRVAVTCNGDNCNLRVTGSAVNINQNWRVFRRRLLNGRRLYASDPWYGPAGAEVTGVRFTSH